MKKRWVASVLAATMAAAVIGGCGSGNAAMGTEGSAEETGVSSDQNETGKPYRTKHRTKRRQMGKEKHLWSEFRRILILRIMTTTI